MKEDEDEQDEVFTVEVTRGPHGLGLALVDGLVRKIYLFFLLWIFGGQLCVTVQCVTFPQKYFK